MSTKSNGKGKIGISPTSIDSSLESASMEYCWLQIGTRKRTVWNCRSATKLTVPFSISQTFTISSNEEVTRKPGTVELKQRPNVFHTDRSVSRSLLLIVPHPSQLLDEQRDWRSASLSDEYPWRRRSHFPLMPGREWWWVFRLHISPYEILVRSERIPSDTFNFSIERPSMWTRLIHCLTTIDQTNSVISWTRKEILCFYGMPSDGLNLCVDRSKISNDGMKLFDL